MSQISYEPIAYFKSSHKETYEAPRQGVLAGASSGVVELSKEFPESALEDLVGFERIWLIYDFHENTTWKPKVRPPRFSEKKRSVFSTRSPYRPNSIGISCVKLDKIDGNKVYVSEHDLLEGTPVLDIKPYLPYADSFSHVNTGWVESISPFSVLFSEEAEKRILWLEKSIEVGFREILTNQLAYEPTNSKAKRVKQSKEPKVFTFSVRTWRFDFKLVDKSVQVFQVYSGYTDSEKLSDEDPYLDKDLHRLFENTLK